MRTYEAKTNTGGAASVFDGNHLNGPEAYSMMQELTNAVVTAGLTPANAAGAAETFFQLSQAMATYGMGGAQYHLDTGAVNAYVLNPVSPAKSPPAYFDGMTVEFKPGNVNTSAATVNVNAIGVKSVVDLSGGALTGGELFGSVKIRYSDSLGKFELISPSPEYQDLTLDGYKVFAEDDNGDKLVLQWGTSIGLIAGQAVGFNIAFSTVYVVLVTDTMTTLLVPASHAARSIVAATGFSHVSEADNDLAFWFAIGRIV